MKIKIAVHQEQLDEITKKMPELQQNIIKLSGEQLDNILKKETPVDLEHLKSAWVKQEGTNKVRFSNSAKYAEYVNEGRGPIHVKNAKALKFTKRGKVIGFAKSAKATQGKHFVEKSVNKLEQKIPNIAKQALDKL